MALKFFDSESNSNGSLSFLKDWLEENPKNKETVFLVTEITRVQSGKGYLIKTNKFAVFAWAKSKTAKNLVEALDYYCSNPQSGYCLMVVLAKPNEDNYQLAVDDEKPTTWFSSKNGYTTSQPVYTSVEESSENPLLIKPGK